METLRLTKIQNFLDWAFAKKDNFCLHIPLIYRVSFFLRVPDTV